MPTPAEALEALRALPCGRELLAALDGVPGAVVVGGAVRDLLLGGVPREVDVAVASEEDLLAVAARLGGELRRHERFGTATVVTEGGCAFDLVRTRAEAYATPGALPDVRPGTLEEDLARRDFAVNAIALDGRGELHAVPGALDDLRDRRLRVLHDRSFLDDPTRLWRLVRYAVRLGFLPDPVTDRLAREAVAGGAPATVSGERLGNELRLALREARPLDVLHAATQLGLVTGLALDPAVVAQALALRPAAEGDGELTLLGATLTDPAWPAGWGFTGAQERVLAACATAPPLPRGLTPGALARALRALPVEAVCVAGARGDAEGARRWLEELRHVRLEITGNDLLAAGVARGPEVGAGLARALEAKLEGRAAGRAAELRAALERP